MKVPTGKTDRSYSSLGFTLQVRRMKFEAGF